MVNTVVYKVHEIPVISGGWCRPAWAEDVQRLAEDVIIQQPGIDAECSHQENDVPTSEEYVPNLLIFNHRHGMLQHA